MTTRTVSILGSTGSIGVQALDVIARNPGETEFHQATKEVLASIGPVTTRAIREAGYSVAVEADPHDVPGLVSAIIDASTRD